MSLAPSPQPAFAEERKSAHLDFTSGFDSLLECCAGTIGTARHGRIQSLLSPTVDWRELASLAEQHDVSPLVYQGLHRSTDAVPPSILAHFRRGYELNAQKNLKLTYELIRILDCLDSSGVDALPYKGPVLAQTLYGDVAVRQFSDLDILIRSADLSRATVALRELSYTPAVKLTKAEERANVATGYERAWDGPAGKNLLEIQWRIVPRFYSIELDVDGLFERSTTISLGGRRVRTLSPEDLLLVLCVHAAKHAWARLSWLCDIARTLRTQVIDYEVVRSRARKLGIARIIGVSLWLANRLLGAHSALVEALIAKDGMIEQVGEQVRDVMTQPSDYDVESPGYFHLMLRARERRRDKVRFLARLAFTPGSGEWSAVQLPEPLFPLYRAVRMARLSSRAVSGIFAKNR